MKALYDSVCLEHSKILTQRYSTSFSAGIRAFSPDLQPPIYAIYGFVRVADEIVDTFFGHPQAELLARFRAETHRAIEEGISTNPILQSFQAVVRQFGIDRELIDAFLDSMEKDLDAKSHEQTSYDTYIYGSAEVVGLMCLLVFCGGDRAEFERLKKPAQRLGSAFQKINFLRDLKSDFEDRGRVYFPGVDFSRFTDADKKAIEKDIEADFSAGLEGIKQLPPSAKFGVYLAYRYYFKLFKKIRATPAARVADCRVRVPDLEKLMLYFRSSVKMQLRLV